ncbi:adenosylcobinamide-GDP ribazoletransferase, partial [Acinetobacter baumannii]|nr:adenosylcobinamide-GDP ribazoletransferase [Acinetobacter baumannii]
LLYLMFQGLFAINIFLISLVYLRNVFIKSIGGITVDIVGAAIEIGETVLMFTFVVSNFYLV